MNHLDTALQWHNRGFNVLPVGENKRPLVSSWKKWQTEGQTEAEVRQLFANDSHGIALICGYNNVEVIDVDIKADPDGQIVEQLKAKLNEIPYSLIKHYAGQTTPSGGIHLIYRLTSPPAGNNGNLARKNGKAIIETRGSGGYALIAPSPGYKMTRDKVLDEVLLEDEHYMLTMLCASFNEDEPVNFRDAEPRKLEGELRPGDKFNRDHGREDVIAMLEAHGWSVVMERGKQVYMRRPDKEHSWSGTWHDDYNKFYCFTSSASPLEGNKAYSPFALLVALQYNGDWSAAARDLAPAPEQKKNEVLTVEQRIQHQPENRWANAYVYDPYADDGKDVEQWVINYESSIRSYEFLARGFMLSIGGMEKSRKSRFLYTLAAGGLTGQPLLGFRWVETPRKILIFDTEQPDFWLKRAGRYMTRIVGNKDWRDVLTFHGIRAFSDSERIDYIEEMLYLARAKGRVDMIIIDGLADLIDDFNDLGKSTKVINRLMTIQEDTIMASVIHLNKGANNQTERGHLGSIWTKKADSIVRMTYDETTMATLVKCHRSRTIPFPEFEFTQDVGGNVVLTTPTMDKYLNM